VSGSNVRAVRLLPVYADSHIRAPSKRTFPSPQSRLLQTLLSGVLTVFEREPDDHASALSLAVQRLVSALLSMLVANIGTPNNIDDGFRNVGGVVANTFDGLCDEQVIEPR
jgi:hypothetical protein